jgi:hypothetical protein
MDAISFCLDYDLTSEEFMAYELVRKSSILACMEYVKKHGEPSSEVLESLYQKGLVHKQTPTANYRYCVIDSSKIQNQTELGMDMAEELWDSYPGALPLSGGGMFIARKGPDKYDVLRLYLDRINNDPRKHEFVLEQLKVYVKLVLDSKINGHRIHDWISNEMWDIIPALQAGSRGEFKTDI